MDYKKQVKLLWGYIDDMNLRIELLEQKLDLAKEALDRLGSMEAFYMTRTVTNSDADKELGMRIDYARETLKKLEEK